MKYDFDEDCRDFGLRDSFLFFSPPCVFGSKVLEQPDVHFLSSLLSRRGRNKVRVGQVDRWMYMEHKVWSV